MMAADSRYVRSTDAVMRSIAGEHLLVPIRRGDVLDAETLYILDDVGAEVWERLDSPRSVADLCASIEELFETGPDDDVAGDLKALLSDLEAQGLVREADAP